MLAATVSKAEALLICSHSCQVPSWQVASKKLATHRVIRRVCTACVIVSKSACSNAVCQSEMTPQLIVPLDAAHKRRDAPLNSFCVMAACDSCYVKR